MNQISVTSTYCRVLTIFALLTGLTLITAMPVASANPPLQTQLFRVNISPATVLERAEAGLRQIGLTLYPPRYTEVTRLGYSGNFTAAVQCWPDGGGTIVSVVMAGADTADAEVYRLHNLLVQYIQTGQSTGGGGGSGGLAAWYRFDEGAGTIARDSSGNGRDLALRGGAGFTEGVQGTGLQLRDSNDLFASRDTDDAVFNFGDRDFSIELSCKFNDFAHIQTLIEKFSGASGPGWTLSMMSRTSLQFYSSGAGTFNAPVDLQPGQWCRLAVRRQNGRLTISVNDTVVLSSAIAGTITPTNMPLLIGKRNAQDARFFPVNGVIDEVRIGYSGGGGGTGGGICDDPRTLTFMDEWLGRAVPPQEPGESLRYEAWGRLVGTSRTATVTVTGPPDTRLTRCEWLWERASQLRSTNGVGTLKEYVEQRRN